MTRRSNYGSPAKLDGQPRNRRLSLVVLALMAVALVTILGVYESIPVRERGANAPNETAQAIRNVQTSQQQAADQLKALQQTISSDRAEMKRLSDEVIALTGKLEALQQSFTSAQKAPSVQPTESPRQKREAGPRTR